MIDDPWPLGTPEPPLPRRARRRGASWRVLPWLVVVVVAALYAGRWLPHLGITADVPWSVLALPAPADRDYPAPGYEEAAERLAPAVAVAAPSGAYAFQQVQDPGLGGGPVAWSPCRPIHVVVDPTGAPEGFRDVVAGALAEVGAATGLTFQDDGVVTEAASAQRPAFLPAQYGDRWAPVLVRFADEVSVPDLAGTVVGVAGVQSVRETAGGRSFLVSGAVYLDTELLARPDAADAYPPVLRHELAHLVGLDHVDDPTQLMYPTTSVPTFQAGDLTGLAALGQGACTSSI